MSFVLTKTSLEISLIVHWLGPVQAALLKCISSCFWLTAWLMSIRLSIESRKKIFVDKDLCFFDFKICPRAVSNDRPSFKLIQFLKNCQQMGL